MQRLFHALHQQLPTTNQVRFKLYFSHFLRHWCFLTSSLSKLLNLSRGHQDVLADPTLVLLQVLLEGLTHAGALTCSADTQNRELPTMAKKNAWQPWGCRVVLKGGQTGDTKQRYVKVDTGLTLTGQPCLANRFLLRNLAS
jgi:hypothetical protein